MEVTCEAMRSFIGPLLYELANKSNGRVVWEKVRTVTAPRPTTRSGVKNSCAAPAAPARTVNFHGRQPCTRRRGKALFPCLVRLVGRIVYMYNSADASLFHCDHDLVRGHCPAEAGARSRPLGFRSP